MKLTKRILAVLLAAAMLVALAACTKPETNPSGDPTAPGSQAPSEPGKTDPAPTEPEKEQPKYGGHANIRIVTSPTSPDPRKRLTTWTYMYLPLCFENPMVLDVEGNVQPAVCNFEVSDDGLTVKLWVRDGKKFSNGDPVDIYDVEASFHRYLNLHSTGPKQAANIESETNDGKVLTIKYKTYQENIMYYFASYKPWMPIMPKEICEEFMTEDIPVERWQDCIGTGPYMYCEFKEKEYVSVKRVPGYEPNLEDAGKTGFAGVKYAYLDSMTFYYNGNDQSSGMALLNHDYDVIEVLPSDYLQMLDQYDLKETVLPSDLAVQTMFNIDGSIVDGVPVNVTAKYPSLRKAIMAAIDYEQFLKVATDNQQIMDGAAVSPFLSPAYYTDAWTKADWYGPTNMEAVRKYLEAAKAEGWDGTEPVRLYASSTGTSLDRATLWYDFLRKAGIPARLETMEATALSDLQTWGKGNNYDMSFSWPACFTLPTKGNVPSTSWCKNDEFINGIKDKLATMPEGTPEYIKLVNEWEQYVIDNCLCAHMGRINWYWYSPKTLMIEDEGPTRYFFNTWWQDPENHPSPFK